MSNEKKFVKGMIPSKFEFSNGGSIIKVGIKVEELCEWLYENINEKGWVNVDICDSKDGSKMYACLNTFQANKD